MKQFSIKVVTKPELEDKYLCAYGQITIGTFKERFRMAIADWTIKDYKKQWREAIKRLEDHDSSCLITSASNMAKDPYVWMYILYKVENTLYIQEKLVCSEFEQHDPTLDYKNLNAQTCYDFIDPRGDEDEKVWEKSVGLEDVLSFKVI